MPFQYIPFQFSGLPQVHCAFQVRPQFPSVINLQEEILSTQPMASDVSERIKNTKNPSQERNLDGNISFTVVDDFTKVVQNRKNMQAKLGIEQFSELKQIHSDIMVFNPHVVSCDEVVQTEADGFASNEKDKALLIKTADCQSILVAHKDGGHIMALHAGWRGNRVHFPTTAIEKFCEQYKLRSKDLFAVRGPSLGPNKAEFTDFEKDWSEDFRDFYNKENKCMNLWALTKFQLMQAGLKEKNLFSIDLCTATMNNDFFSYRFDKNCGRQASLIWIETIERI